MNRIKYITLCILLLCSPYCHAGDISSLKRDIAQFISDKDVEAGVAVIMNGHDTLTVNNDVRYPLMSVFKLHQAVAVAHRLSEKGVPLDTLMYISSDDLKKDTYSPLRDKYPDAERYFSVRELLRYTLLLSDNNACDILFDRIVSIGETDIYLRSLGIKDFSINVSEEDMHHNSDLCYDNWSTPLSAASLMERLMRPGLMQEEYRLFLLNTMMECQTGKNRIPSFPHGNDVKVGNKTGTGSRNADGRIIAVNDMGFVILPDGQYYTVAVFIKDSDKDIEYNENVIAEISLMIYDYVNKKEGKAC